MHEATLVAGIVRIAEEEARKHGAEKITRVRVHIGLLACVEEQTLEGCFALWTEQGLARDAVLEVRREPLACHCAACGLGFSLHERHFVCPHCASRHLMFTGGHECYIGGIDVTLTAP